MHKALRFYPMAAITCAAGLILSSIRALEIHDMEKLTGLWSVKTLISNFLLLFRGWPKLSMMGINNPAWYLCILLQCYIVFYFFLWLAEKLHLNPNWFFAAFFLSTIVLRHFQVISDAHKRGFACFFLGGMIEQTLTFLDEKQGGAAKKIEYIYIAVMTACFVGMVLFRRDVVVAQQRRAVVFMIYPALLVCAYCAKDVHSGIIRVFGKMSFETYLWHSPLLTLFHSILFLFAREMHHSYFTMAVFTIVAEAFSYFIYKKIELPMNNHIRVWEKKRLRRDTL